MRTPARPAGRLITIAEAEEIEDAWRPSSRPDLMPGPDRWGAEPYPARAFMVLLGAAITSLARPVPVFCDVGAGPGAKVLLAQQEGCSAWGVELVPGMADAARSYGADVIEGAAEGASLDGTDIVYLNQLYRDTWTQQRIQEAVCGRMRPGAVLILVNSPAPPPWPGRAWPPGSSGPPWAGCWTKPPNLEGEP